MNLQNKSVVLNVVLAIVAVVLGVRLASGEAPAAKSADAEQSSNAEQAVLDNIATLTSIRDYEARPVENEKIEKMLRAAMAAPTAMNKPMSNDKVKPMIAVRNHPEITISTPEIR